MSARTLKVYTDDDDDNDDVHNDAEPPSYLPTQGTGVHPSCLGKRGGIREAGALAYPRGSLLREDPQTEDPTGRALSTRTRISPP